MKNKGFTLIELLIVVAILAILGGIAYVQLQPKKLTDKAKASTIESEMSQLHSSSGTYVTDNNSYSGICSSDDFTKITDKIKNDDGATNVNCNANDNGFAVKATFNNNGTNTYYCVDSGGVKKRTSSEYTISNYKCE